MAKAVKAAPKARENPPLLFIMLLLPLFFGGYYNFSVFLIGMLLVIFLAHRVLTTGNLLCPSRWAGFALLALLLGNLLAIVSCVSVGMTVVGALRVGVWGLFALYVMTYTHEERQSILDTLSYEGAILSAFTIFIFFYDMSRGIEDANGRIDGLFEYANTWGLYLLICLVLLTLKSKRHWADWPGMAVLVAGIYLSGSRGIFLILLPLLLCYGLWLMVKKGKWKPVLIATITLLLLGLGANFVTNGQLWNRIQAITLGASSVSGRLLYYLDGLEMIWEHPLGIGRGGYLYLQPLYQSGVYTLQYIHNAYLQMALDGGILAGVSMIGLVICCLLQKGLPLRNRIVIGVIALHFCIDFDPEFFVIIALLLLCGMGEEGRPFTMPTRVSKGVAALMAGLFLFFTGVYYSDFIGNADLAYSLFSTDLTLAEHRLQSCATLEEARPIAEDIVSDTDLSMLAWDCLYTIAQQEGDWPGMLEQRYRYLLLNPYRGEVYQEMTTLLELAYRQDHPELVNNACKRSLEVLEYMGSIQRGISPLAYQIVDKPQFDFVSEIEARLTALTS